MKHLKSGVFALAAVFAVGGSGSAQAQFGGPPIWTPEDATAVVWGSNGASLGSAGIWKTPNGIAVAIRVDGGTPGAHGVHLHAVGRCEGPGFASAGGHLNPAGKQHGSMNPMGPHMGDLPNLVLDQQGRGFLTFEIPGATLDDIFDADGTAIVVHADRDDLKTDPSGNSGVRVGCGVFVKPVRMPAGPPPRRPTPPPSE